jgi:hypothetical protein
MARGGHTPLFRLKPEPHVWMVATESGLICLIGLIRGEENQL